MVLLKFLMIRLVFSMMSKRSSSYFVGELKVFYMNRISSATRHGSTQAGS